MLNSADTVRIENFDGLYALFTSLEPDAVRTAVLQRIADPRVEIGIRNWENCLFAVAIIAAMRAKTNSVVRVGRMSIQAISVTQELGVSTNLVREGIGVWDYGTDGDRDAFRGRIRAYLRQENQMPAVNPQPQSAARRLMATVRELVGVK